MVNLHVHSMFSLRDSIIKPKELSDKILELGQSSVAITDHGNSLGAVGIYKTLKKNGIKFIHGCEFYICDDLNTKDKNNRYYHLVALCKNETGRLNLNKLISLSELPENKYYKPRIDFNLLSEHCDGLVILSACMAGEISRFLENNDEQEAQNRALKYKKIFGSDYYLEIQSHSDVKQIELNKKILSLAKKLSIECVVTTDAHYVNKEDRYYQNQYAFNGSYKEDGEAYIDCYLQREEEVREKMSYLTVDDLNSVIKNTDVISDKCNCSIPLSAPIMPKIDTPKEFDTNKEWLISICKDGFRTKLNIDFDNRCIFDKSKTLSRDEFDEDGEYLRTVYFNFSDDEIKEYIERLNYEIDSLDRMGFVDYILLVFSYANVAKRRGIARGSGGGSLVCYVSNITDIDPIEFKLYFERFIDVGALELLESGEITAKELKIPDIDLDFSGSSCEEVLRFLYNKYGEDKVASIGKFGTNQTKGTIRDMCKVLEYSLEKADEIAKSFDGYEIFEIDDFIKLKEEDKSYPIPKSAYSAIENVKDYPKLFDLVRKLHGLPKSFGLHACGKIISTMELDYFLPSCYDSNGVRYLQGDMHDVEDVGLVKIDVLGLRTIDQEYDTIEMSGETLDYINPKKQNYSDKNVLDIFRNGDTVGIFQMASFGMRQTLKKMNISGIEDLSIANALYRPGAMAYIDNFCQRRIGNEKFEYLHPDLENILSNTYGIIVFQEQLIEIGRMAKIHNPDLLRKATGKKDIKMLNKVKPELENNLISKGWTQEQFNTLWADMIEFSKYSFNKSHSSAYAIIAYMTAKQKAYYPKEFYAGLLNSYIGKNGFVKDEVDEIISDMKMHKIQIKSFNFRNDHRRCSVLNGKLLYAIPLIRDCNELCSNVLFNSSKNKYKYFCDFLSDIVPKGINKSQLDIFVKLDFFSEFGNAKELLRIIDWFNFFKQGDAKTIKKEKINEEFVQSLMNKYAKDTNAKGQPLKSYTIIDCQAILHEGEEKIKSFHLEDMDVLSKIRVQKEYLGYVSATEKEEDRAKLLVEEVYPLKRKKDGKQFGYSVICNSIGSGKKTRFTVFSKDFNRCGEITKGDIVLCISWKRDGEYFSMSEYKKIY